MLVLIRSTSGLDECDGLIDHGGADNTLGPRIDMTSASTKFKSGLSLPALTFCDLSTNADN